MNYISALKQIKPPREIQHYTQDVEDETTCMSIGIITLMDSYLKKRVSREPKNISARALRLHKSLLSDPDWKFPSIYALADYAANKHFITIIVTKNKTELHPWIKHTSLNISIFKNIRKRAISDGAIEVINKNPDKYLQYVAGKGIPVIAFMADADLLYSTRKWGETLWHGHTLIVKQYNKITDSYVIYDPLYYIITKNPKYIPNPLELKGIKEIIKDEYGNPRYIAIDRKHFIKAWSEKMLILAK